MLKRSFGIALTAVLLLSAEPGTVRADKPSVSADRARAAMEAGLVQPLETLLLAAQKRYEGQLIEAVLREEQGIWIYEFEFLPPGGKIFEIEMNAKTGAVLSTVGPVREKR